MLNLDPSGREPIYIQIEKEIIKLINLGVYQPDSPLPSVRALATQLSINPNTVSKAYKNLELHGVIYTVAGKGVFVRKTDMASVREKARGLLLQVLGVGVGLKPVLLHHRHHPLPRGRDPSVPQRRSTMFRLRSKTAPFTG